MHILAMRMVDLTNFVVGDVGEFQCNTCGRHPTSAICQKCFEEGDHEGHDCVYLHPLIHPFVHLFIYPFIHRQEIGREKGREQIDG
jgi:hypothetical protein